MLDTCCTLVSTGVRISNEWCAHKHKHTHTHAQTHMQARTAHADMRCSMNVQLPQDQDDAIPITVPVAPSAIAAIASLAQC